MINGKKVLFSGMQATGNLTLGNYLGALKNWVEPVRGIRVLLQRGGSAFHHRAAGSDRAAAARPQPSDDLYCGRAGSGEELPLLSVSCVRSCGTGMDPELLYLYG